MKKYSWIAALLVALAFAFVACDDGDSSKKKDDGKKDLPTVELTGEEIVIRAIGGDAKDIVIDKNTFAVTAVKSSSIGFVYDFPDEVKGKGYGTVIVEVELLSETAAIIPDFISFNPKADTTMGTNIQIIGHTEEYHGELKIGTITDKEVSAPCDDDVCLQYAAGSCVKGAKGSGEYPMKKLTNGLIAFQYNPYAGDITTPGWTNSSNATFKIAVTKITFPGGAVVEEEAEEEKEVSADDAAKFAAVTGLTGIFTNEWNASPAPATCKMFGDNTTGIISRTEENGTQSSLLSIAVPATVTIQETQTIKIAVAILATGQVKLTAKQPGTGNDLSTATYLDVTSSTETGFLEKVIEIPAARYQSGGSFAAPAKLSFQDNGGGDWQMKVKSITAE